MTALRPSPASFERIDVAIPASPIVVSVPHAGRDYPASLLASARLPRSRLELLEDRFVDHVVAAAGLADATVIVARRARAWIDLNRDPRELDPAMFAPEPPIAAMLRTAKVRDGLGVIPRSIGRAGDINAGRMTLAEAEARIANDHTPYHEAIECALRAASRRFGVALLVDCHSMPALTSLAGKPQPRIVFGDRFGRSADARFVGIAMAVATTAGLTPVLNIPYAGGYTLDRHGAPIERRHALQVEIDRSLYLDTETNQPGPGLPRIARWLGALVDHLSAACLGEERTVAAE